VKYTQKIFFLLFAIAVITPPPALHAAQDPAQYSDSQPLPRTPTNSPAKFQSPHKTGHPQTPYPGYCCPHPQFAYPGYSPYAAAPQPGAQAGNVNIVLSSNNSSEQAAQLHAMQHAHQQQYQHQEVEQVTLVSIARDCESFLSNHRWTLFFGFLVAGYVMMCKRIKDDQDFLARRKNWANWRAYDAQQLESCLAADIQYRYFNPQDPTNYSAALSECALDMEHEELRYSRIMRLYKWLKKWYLYLLFPMSKEDLKEVRAARERFEAMRRIYLRLVASGNPYIAGNATYNPELPCTLPCCNPEK